MSRNVPRGWLLGALSCLLFAAGVSAGEKPTRTAASTAPAVRILVAYHTLRGTTRQLAESAAAGARSAGNVSVVIKPVEKVVKEDLLAANGIVLGCPTYYANIPGAMKVAIDDWSWNMDVDFTDKVGGAFATGGGQTGGKEHVVVSLLLFMVNNRMVVAGPLYEDEEGEDIWAELGATAATGPTDAGVSDSEREAAQRVGWRVADVAKKMLN